MEIPHEFRNILFLDTRHFFHGRGVTLVAINRSANWTYGIQAKYCKQYEAYVLTDTIRLRYGMRPKLSA
jgi:hypothetical protein